MADRSIFRQVIPVNDQWHTLYLSGPVVHVATRHEDCVEIWFLEDPAAEAEPRTFRVYGTGYAIDDPQATHVRSAVTPTGRFVWHLFERGSADAAGHIIEVRETGWTIMHPLACRPRLFDCEVNRAAERDLTEPPADLGRFRCDAATGRFAIGGRVDDAPGRGAS